VTFGAIRLLVNFKGLRKVSGSVFVFLVMLIHITNGFISQSNFGMRYFFAMIKDVNLKRFKEVLQSIIKFIL